MLLKKYRLIAVILIVLGAASYGILSPLIKIAYGEGWSSGEITFVQMGVGTVINWLLVLVRPKSWSNPFRGAWIQLSMVGIFGLGLTTVLYNIALTELDASIAIVLMFQFTWMTILMDSIVNRRWPSRYQFAAIVMVMAGTLFAVNIFAADWSRFSLLGIGLGLCSAAGYSLFLFLTGRIKDATDPMMKSAIMLTAALLPICLIYPPHFMLKTGADSLLLWGLLLGMLGQVIPTIFFNIGIPRVGSSVAAMLGSIELPVAVLGALLIVGESVLAVQWFGMLLILVGILISEMKHLFAK